jgi:hypothetical protein
VGRIKPRLTFAGAARLALLGGAAGLVWSIPGEKKVAILCTVHGAKIAATDLVSHPERVVAFELAFLGSRSARAQQRVRYGVCPKVHSTIPGVDQCT